jgi:ATP-dependent DNA helicase RecG
MRRMGTCEEKGSGVDKVISAVEAYQLPAPVFRDSEQRTHVILFGHKAFQDMDRSDRVRACYQHCVLRYINNQRMTNQSLRERFGLPDNNSKRTTVSQIITATLEAGQIRLEAQETKSTRYTRYIPSWA